MAKLLKVQSCKLYINKLFFFKKSHWLNVPVSKLLVDQSGNIKILNGFFRKYLQVENGKT